MPRLQDEGPGVVRGGMIMARKLWFLGVTTPQTMVKTLESAGKDLDTDKFHVQYGVLLASNVALPFFNRFLLHLLTIDQALYERHSVSRPSMGR